MTDNGDAKAGFGFKIQGKARQKVQVNVQDKQEYKQLISGVEGNVIQSTEPSDSGKQQYVIPKLQNTFKAGVGKFIPSFVPEPTTAAVTGNSEDRFERAAAPDAPTMTHFGLEVRQHNSNGNAGAANGAANGIANGAGSVPALAAHSDEAAQLKADLETLPEVATVEDYESLPVEEFGKALLRGLGWSDGQGVGRKRQLVEPKQIIRRPDRLGLGANPAAPPPDRRPRKMGDKPKEDLVAAPAADGTMRHRVGLDEQLVPRSSLLPGPQPGKVMQVAGGRHAGLMCVVRELLPNGEECSGSCRVWVELQPSAEMVVVAAHELGERGTNSLAAANKQQGQQGQQRRRNEFNRGKRDNRGSSRDREHDAEQRQDRGHSREDKQRSSRDSSKERGRGNSRDWPRGSSRECGLKRSKQQDDDRSPLNSRDWQHGSSSRDRHRRDEGYQENSSDSEEQQQRQRRRGQQQHAVMPPHQMWLAPLIRVRVVDKHLQKGKLYLKKGVVLDVAPDGTCEVRMDETKHVINAFQNQLETVVPKEAGAAVMVVRGQHKGRNGRLLQVSISGGAVALQLAGNMEVVRLLLDDVAQFTGQLDEEDH